MDNPYSPPSATEPLTQDSQTSSHQLATRGSRFLASLLDGIIVTGPLLIVIFFILPTFASDQFEIWRFIDNSTYLYDIVFGLIFYILFLIINWVFLKNGQTIGKKALKIQVRTLTGDIPSANDQAFRRYLFYNLISSIPVVGNILSLINILFIFGSEHRCLHDRVAGTIVIKKPDDTLPTP